MAKRDLIEPNPGASVSCAATTVAVGAA